MWANQSYYNIDQGNIFIPGFRNVSNYDITWRYDVGSGWDHWIQKLEHYRIGFSAPFALYIYSKQIVDIVKGWWQWSISMIFSDKCIQAVFKQNIDCWTSIHKIKYLKFNNIEQNLIYTLINTPLILTSYLLYCIATPPPLLKLLWFQHAFPNPMEGPNIQHARRNTN